MLLRLTPKLFHTYYPLCLLPSSISRNAHQEFAEIPPAQETDEGSRRVLEPLCVPKTSPDDDFGFCAPNSLFSRQNSLFRRNNSLFGRLGNLHGKPRNDGIIYGLLNS
jgi:hypothetical protein